MTAHTSNYIWMLSVFYDNIRSAQDEMDEKNDGDADIEFPVLGLVVENAHTEGGAHASANSGEKQQSTLPCAAGTPFCSALVRAHGGKRYCVYYKKIDD